MKIHLATDHAGFKHKEAVKEYLTRLGKDIVDHGAFTFTPDDDYPDFIRPVAEAVAKDPQSRGIIIGGSGQGEAMCANRVKGVRAAVYYGGAFDIAVLSREHNDANILSLGARFIEEEEAKKIVRVWLDTAFSDEEKHARRIQKLDI